MTATAGPQLSVIQTINDMHSGDGGPARSCRSLTESLARSGARVTLLAGDHGHAPDSLLLPDPALVSSALLPKARHWGLAVPGFATAIAARAAERPAILHDNGIWKPGNALVASAASRHGLPLVISPHGMLTDWAMGHKALKKQLAWALYQKRLMAGAAGLHATAEPERAGLRARFPALPIATIANGVDCPASLPDPVPRHARAERTALVLSRLHLVKNLPGLVAAWARIAADPAHDAWTLLLHGPDHDGHRAEIMAAIAAHGLQHRIRVGDAVAEADKAALYANADLFILPSFSENFGIVVAEAMAHGLPVIASTGTPWAVLPAIAAGWHVAPEPDSLAAALAEALALTPEARTAMGLRGRTYVERNFGWDRIAADMLAFYHWLLTGGRAPDHVEPGAR